MNEAALKSKFKEHWPGYMINISQRFASGTPDSYCAYAGASCWIEFKVDSNKPTKLQDHEMHKITDNGIIAMVVKYVNKDKKYIADISYPHITDSASYIETLNIKHLVEYIKHGIINYHNRYRIY